MKTQIDESGLNQIVSFEFGIQESSPGQAVCVCVLSFVLVCIGFRGYKGIWMRADGGNGGQ